MSNPRESREQDPRAETIGLAQAAASGGLVTVVGVILLASWILKAEPRPAPAPRPPPATAAGPAALPPPQVLAPLVETSPSAEPAPAPAPAPVEAAPLASAPAQPARSHPLAERAVRDAARLAGQRGAWTAQVAAVCSEDLVAAHVRSTGGSDRLYLLPVTIKDRSCYRVLWGTFASAAAAAAADVPAALRTKEKPRVVAVAELFP